MKIMPNRMAQSFYMSQKELEDINSLGRKQKRKLEWA